MYKSAINAVGWRSKAVEKAPKSAERRSNSRMKAEQREHKGGIKQGMVKKKNKEKWV